MGTLKRTSHVEVVADASPEAVWAVVTDVARIGDWSHETRDGVWSDGDTSARPGARFRARNRVGSRKWSRVNEVVTVDAPRTFAWKTVASPLFNDSTLWTISLVPVDGGTRIVQRYEILKLNPILDRIFYLTTPAHRDRTAKLEDDMRRLGEVARTGVAATG
jgi:uncharacterized protein YndB with AHSA1/START domain